MGTLEINYPDSEACSSDDEDERANVVQSALDSVVQAVSKLSSPLGDDLNFLLFSLFIYDKRTRSSTNSSVDGDLEKMASWLKETNKLNTDVDPCQAVTLNSSDPDTPHIIDALNTYAPAFPITLLIGDSSDTYVAKRLHVSSYTCDVGSGAIDLPFFHEGRIYVSGDLSFDGVVDLLTTQSVFTTDVDVSGSLVGCDRESVERSLMSLKKMLQVTSDGDIHQFSVRGGCHRDIKVRSKYVRRWVISFTRDGDRGCLCLKKS